MNIMLLRALLASLSAVVDKYLSLLAIVLEALRDLKLMSTISFRNYFVLLRRKYRRTRQSTDDQLAHWYCFARIAISINRRTCEDW